MSKALLLILTLSLFCFAEEITLGKDEIYSTTINGDTREKKLFFKWVLYKNSGLSVILNYDKFNYHFILYKEFYKNSFMLNLDGNSFTGHKKGNFLYLKFEEFKDNKAKFNLYTNK